MKKIKNNEQNVRSGEKSRQQNINCINRARREYDIMHEHWDRLVIEQRIRNITK